MASQTPGYQHYPCDLCGSEEAVEIPYVRFYTGNQPVHICSVCGFVYVRMRRSSEEIARVWSEELYGGVYTAKKHPVMMPRYHYVAGFSLPIRCCLPQDLRHRSRRGALAEIPRRQSRHRAVRHRAIAEQLRRNGATGYRELHGNHRAIRRETGKQVVSSRHRYDSLDSGELSVLHGYAPRGGRASSGRRHTSSWQRAAGSWFRSRSRCSLTSHGRRRTFIALGSARTLCKPRSRKRDSVP